MQLHLPQDRNEISGFLSRNYYLNIYAIGDLDDRFLPYTLWYGIRTSGNLSAVVCIYIGGRIPTLMAFTDSCGEEPMKELLNEIMPLQPDKLNANLSPGLEEIFLDRYTAVSVKPHYKMALVNPFALERINSSTAEMLNDNDIPALLELYEKSYPDNWFDPDMFPINRYCGIREYGKLVAAAGTHVHSEQFAVTALGNIAVLPHRRGLGLGALVTAALAKHLTAGGNRIGLNVKQENKYALAAYEKTGFRINAEYNELVLKQRV